SAGRNYRCPSELWLPGAASRAAPSPAGGQRPSRTAHQHARPGGRSTSLDGPGAPARGKPGTRNSISTARFHHHRGDRAAGGDNSAGKPAPRSEVDRSSPTAFENNLAANELTAATGQIAGTGTEPTGPHDQHHG